MARKAKKTYSLPVLIERDEDGYFIGSVPSLKSCHTQAKTLPELYKRLEEVVALCMEMDDNYHHNEFIGVQRLEFSV